MAGAGWAGQMLTSMVQMVVFIHLARGISQGGGEVVGTAGPIFSRKKDFCSRLQRPEIHPSAITKVHSFASSTICFALRESVARDLTMSIATTSQAAAFTVSEGIAVELPCIAALSR